MTAPPFDDVRVRKAFAMAVDRETLCTRVLKSDQEPAYFFTPPGSAGYTCEARIPYDTGEAQRLLAEAGYPGGKDLPPVELL